MLKDKYFTKNEISKTMQNAGDYSADDFYDLFEAMFNRDYYITGKHEASEALKAFKNGKKLDGYKTKFDGEIGAVELVERYELDQFGSILTPLFNEPEKLANRIEYIRGETLFYEALNNASLDLFETPTEESLKKFTAAAKEL